MSNSPDLSRYFAHTAILPMGGASVKGVTPELTICFSCKQPSFSVYLDPRSPGLHTGRWMFCGACGWRGDSVEALDSINRSGDLKRTIRDAVRDGKLCTIPAGALTTEMIDGYIANYPARRQKLQKIWAHLSKDMMLNPHPDLMHRIQKDHLWGGWRNGQQERFTRFVGGGVKKDIMAVFSEYYAREGSAILKDALPKQGFRTCLILNYQDAPGRTTAFEFIGDYQHERSLKIFEEAGNQQYREGGLAMLDTLLARENDVFATSHPMLALQLQRRNMSESERPLKMVVFNNRTEHAWRCVSAERVLFFEPWGLNWKIFENAKAVSNGYIFSKDLSPENSNSWLLTEPLSSICNAVTTRAVKWENAFVSWILESGMTDSEAKDNIAALKFLPVERDKILTACTREQLHRMKYFIGESRHVKQATINGHNFTEQDENWYLIRPNLGPELICDATLHIESEICDTERGVTHWQGYIAYKGKHIPFRELVEVIEAKPEAWLRKQLALAGLGTPFLQKRNAKDITTLAPQFSPPRVTTASSRFGILEDGSIVFPRFKLVNGEVIPDETLSIDSATPMSTVFPPNPRKVDFNDQYSLTRCVYIAGACTVIANWIALLQSLPVMPVVIGGGVGSTAQGAIKALVKAFDFTSRSASADDTREIERLRSKVGTFRCPEYIESTVQGALPSYPTKNNDFIFMAATVEEMAAFTVSPKSWIVLNAPGLCRDTLKLPPVDDFVYYLMNLQSRDYNLANDDLSLVHAVIVDFYTWYGKYLRLDESDSMATTLELTVVPEITSDSLIHLFFVLFRAGRMNLDHASLEAIDPAKLRRTGITVDDQGGRVFLSRQALLKCIKAQKLPMPDIAAASEDLLKRKLWMDGQWSDDGWMITKSYWDIQIARWRNVYKP